MFAQVQQEIVDGPSSAHPSVPQQLHVTVGGVGRRFGHHFEASFRSGRRSGLCARTEDDAVSCRHGSRAIRWTKWHVPVGFFFRYFSLLRDGAENERKKNRETSVKHARVVCAARLRDGAPWRVTAAAGKEKRSVKITARTRQPVPGGGDDRNKRV